MSSLLSGDFKTAFYMLFIRLIIALTALPIHECAHGYAALKMGDHTAEYQGRLTLNPLAHFDPIGTTAIILFGFGWAKPVQINPLNFNNPKKGMMISALAGPMSNMALAFLSMVCFKLCGIPYLFAENTSFLDTLSTFFYYSMIINISLGVFNLIPIPPLDGSRIATYFLPQRLYFKIMQYEKYIFIVLIALMWFGVLDGIVSFVSSAVSILFDFITRPVDWLVAIVSRQILL